MRYIHKQDPEEQGKREALLQLEKQKGSSRKKKKIATLGIILLLLVAVTTYIVMKPGKYDDFAKCLTEKGAKMYGEDWCPYTKGQKNMFGKSFKYVDYEVKQGLNLRPTWIINGTTYETVQSFQKLSELTGCKY